MALMPSSQRNHSAWSGCGSSLVTKHKECMAPRNAPP
jgi:hypothetical protein